MEARCGEENAAGQSLAGDGRWWLAATGWAALDVNCSREATDGGCGSALKNICLRVRLLQAEQHRPKKGTSMHN